MLLRAAWMARGTKHHGQGEFQRCRTEGECECIVVRVRTWRMWVYTWVARDVHVSDEFVKGLNPWSEVRILVQVFQYNISTLLVSDLI